MKAFLLFLVLLSLFLNACDTAGTVESPAKSYFLKYFGREGNQTGVDVVANPDGTFILLGTTRLNQQLGVQTHLYLVKADAFGNVIWEKNNIGGEAQARDVELASDGRIMVLGNALNAANNWDILVMRFNQDGTRSGADSVLIGLNDSFGQPVNADEDAASITQIDDGGFIIAGSSGDLFNDPTPPGPSPPPDVRDAIHVRILADLTMYPPVWKQATGSGTHDYETKVIQQGPNLFYVFGYTDALNPASTSLNADLNFWVFSLGATGEVNGQAVLFGLAGSDEKLGSVVMEPLQFGGSFFLGGVSTNNATKLDYAYILKLRNQLGFDATDAQNQTPRSLGTNLGIQSVAAEHTRVNASLGSGYFVLTNESSTGNFNLFLTKININGEDDWKSPLLYGGQGDDFSGSVTELPDGKIVIIGTMAIGQNAENKMVLIKVNKDGKFSD